MALTTTAKLALAYYAGNSSVARPSYDMHRALISGGYLTPAGVLTEKGQAIVDDIADPKREARE